MVAASLLGNAAYGANPTECSEFCLPSANLTSTGSTLGRCMFRGYSSWVSTKSVQPSGFASPFQASIWALCGPGFDLVRSVANANLLSTQQRCSQSCVATASASMVLSLTGTSSGQCADINFTISAGVQQQTVQGVGAVNFTLFDKCASGHLSRSLTASSSSPRLHSDSRLGLAGVWRCGCHRMLRVLLPNCIPRHHPQCSSRLVSWRWLPDHRSIHHRYT
jgi:hypothetical protein